MKLKIYDSVGFIGETYDLIDEPTESELWKKVGMTLEKAQIPSSIYVEYGYSSAELEIGKRGKFIKNGITMPSMYVRVRHNNIYLPYEDYKEAYLTCINTESNNYKFYHLKPDNSTQKLDCAYGRIGSSENEAFGRHNHLKEPYDSYLYWIRYYEKLSKGYIDQTDIFLNNSSENSEEEIEKVEEVEKTDKNKASIELYAELKRAAKHIVEEALVNSEVTEAQVKEIRRLLDVLSDKKTVKSFNEVLKQILVLSPRKSRYINTLLAYKKQDFEGIYDREEQLLTAMETLLGKKTSNHKNTIDHFRDLGIEVYEATPKQIEEVKKHLEDNLDTRVVTVYRVINKAQKERFNDYLKKNKIKTVRQFWHGSVNENWLSIIINGLKLNPSNVRITGKMFGYGIYFAPKAQKSMGYTSCNGSYWAHGKLNNGYMGLYATAYGHPEYVTSSGQYNEDYIKSKHKNCVYAKAKNTGLRNDEIIFYNEDAVLLNYIVEFYA